MWGSAEIAHTPDVAGLGCRAGLQPGASQTGAGCELDCGCSRHIARAGWLDHVPIVCLEPNSHSVPLPCLHCAIQQMNHGSHEAAVTGLSIIHASLYNRARQGQVNGRQQIPELHTLPGRRPDVDPYRCRPPSNLHAHWPTKQIRGCWLYLHHETGHVRSSAGGNAQWLYPVKGSAMYCSLHSDHAGCCAVWCRCCRR